MNESIQREVYWMLRDTSKYLKNHLRKKIEEYGITWQQFHALYHIGNDGIPTNELAKELNCNASNITGIIDRMSENGWVIREHSLEDRRVWLVKLTEEGEKLKTMLLPKHRNNMIKSMSVLDEEELKTLKTLLGKLMNEEEQHERD